MKAAVFFFTSFIALSIIHADEVRIPVQGGNWSVRYKGPALEKKLGEKTDDGFQFKANAGRFNLSLFVEAPQGEGKTHKDVEAFYWAQSKRNPTIVASSIQIQHRETFSQVSYTQSLKAKEEDITVSNMNFYFIHEGKWMDLHVSVIVPTRSDEAMLEGLADSLQYGQEGALKPRQQTFTLPDGRRISIVMPPGWSACRSMEFEAKLKSFLTIHVSPDEGGNTVGKLSFAEAPRAKLEKAALEEDVKSMLTPMLASAVEKEISLKPFNLKRGLGAYGLITDASLVGKPPRFGDAKALGSGQIRLAEKLLGVVSLFTDDPADEEFQKLIHAAESVTLESPLQ